VTTQEEEKEEEIDAVHSSESLIYLFNNISMLNITRIIPDDKVPAPIARKKKY
jgi:hypothetical protein